MGQPMSESAIRLAGVAAGYRGAAGARRVLSGLDLTVGRGEMVALLGANGSGKTTLLNVMAGTIQPTAGMVELFGRPLPSWSRGEVARSVAVLPQALELPAGFRVAEVVAMGRTAHGARWFGWTPDDLRAVEDALRDADALELADRPVTELSGGERQRVLVALALAQEPSLLLLDEPTTHLDVAHAAWLLANVARLRQVRGLTVVMVLHDLVLASAWAPRVVLLHGGRILADGPPEVALRPDIVRDAYGVAVETVVTEAGRRLIVPHVPASAPEAAAGPAGSARSAR
jgi:iron complex transport system ATP-binding protein